MAFRTLFHLNFGPERCLLKNINCYKTFTNVVNSPKNCRGFKRLKDTSNQAESNISSLVINEMVPSVRRLWKPFGFTIIIGSAAHIGAAIWEYERIRDHTYKLINRYQQLRINKIGWRGELEKWWQNLTEGQRVFAPICFLNILVFLAWRIPVLNTTMIRYFCANPACRNLCWPMLFSTFSHISIIHLSVNMYVLQSFCTAAVSTLGREQFVALYLTSGMTASFFSQVYKTVTKRPGLSLGASGSIMGVVSFICLQYPDIRLSIAFLPMLNFKAIYGIKGLAMFDIMGCLFKWSIFDHAAHLGGAFWGLFWQKWGNRNLWQKREPFLNFWHSIREPPRS
ncbi:presenilins-associated rhomboid-like protein, mitochondrial [Chelonus insularis]|uniref:presenilins-associated rhomboid-like protein, mitochondrial n=1 Tax=Chelonus insularis TaxID=460826 RepID=UPI001589A176|nr:presenilins-associated rhomboid-like protein, mitochondrial [Chelonus insularis]